MRHLHRFIRSFDGTMGGCSGREPDTGPWVPGWCQGGCQAVRDGTESAGEQNRFLRSCPLWERSASLLSVGKTAFLHQQPDDLSQLGTTTRQEQGVFIVTSFVGVSAPSRESNMVKKLRSAPVAVSPYT